MQCAVHALRLRFNCESARLWSSPGRRAERARPTRSGAKKIHLLRATCVRLYSVHTHAIYGILIYTLLALSLSLHERVTLKIPPSARASCPTTPTREREKREPLSTRSAGEIPLSCVYACGAACCVRLYYMWSVCVSVSTYGRRQIRLLNRPRGDKLRVLFVSTVCW